MKIAVIIPIYNGENTIRRAIKSIDTTHEVEIICVNDGSTDHTRQVLTQLQKEEKNLLIFNRDNQGAATSRNIGLAAMSDDVEAFMFLDADDQFLPGRLDKMIDYYVRNKEVDIVVGQIGRGVNGDWKIVPTHEEMNREDIVTLAQAPEILQSIGPGGKLFNSKFNALRFDEDVVFCEEHTFITRAYLTARDIQLLPLIVYGYNEREGSVTDKRADVFLDYIEDARRVRQSVMEMLLLTNEKTYYSYRMDNLIVSYLIQAYLLKYSKITSEFVDKVTHYINDMQHTNYSGDALFRIIQAVEQGATNWTHDTYEKWRQTLVNVGIGRPGYFRFKAQIMPKKFAFNSKQTVKRMLKR
ncbi:glycosyltransferase family 2 protein [Staphylococcus taiwanensis]|nr:glycosyltransferase family 2 protein [Staphylococcus taiwanensis]